uniref:Uncharacterized protein n=1 Tax=Arundo donax TaxID=35708 RepID=A0A0A9C9Y6_ARUDO
MFVLEAAPALSNFYLKELSYLGIDAKGIDVRTALRMSTCCGIKHHLT